jgi:hypothetical protein
MLIAFLKVLHARFRGRPLDLEYGSRRFHLFPDGSMLPVIAGADGADDPDPNDADPDDPDPEIEDDPIEPAPDDTEPPAAKDEGKKPRWDGEYDQAKAERTIDKQRIEEKRLKAERDKVKAERDALLAEKETEQERTARLLEETKAENDRLREASRSATISGALRDIAIERDIDPKRVNKVIRLIDRSDITVDEDGDVLGADEAVEAFLADYPEFGPKEAEPEPDPEDDEPEKPKRTPGANPDRKRSKGGEMSHKEAVRLSTRDPEKFAEMLAEGKIPRSALGGDQYDKLKSEGKLSTASAEGESA